MALLFSRFGGLSNLYSKKYEPVRRAKAKMSFSSSPHPDSLEDQVRVANRYGELEVKQYVLLQHRITDTEAEEMSKAYLDGRTTYELAEKYGCNRHAVVYALKKKGIVADKAKARKKLDIPKVLAMYEEYTLQMK